MRISILLITIAIGLSAFGQKILIRDRTIRELTCFIENAYEFLGKTDSAIIAAGRPASITGGDKWEAEVIKTRGKNSMNASKTIVTNTGCGAVMFIVSEKTKLVYLITFLPHRKAKLKGDDIKNALKDKYTFDEKGDCYIPAGPFSFIGVSLLEGALIIAAIKADKQSMRFAE